jgi:hypothetical protein
MAFLLCYTSSMHIKQNTDLRFDERLAASVAFHGHDFAFVEASEDAACEEFNLGPFHTSSWHQC